ncbi:hypothetical protein CUMW_237800 [Citrus unshiu]|nr:hypothetical protein CUMW_237800 [Citrus unshiu]
MLMSAGPNLIDPRGRLLPRSYDVLGLYSTFIFQKPDPDVAPPLATPLLQDNEAKPPPPLSAPVPAPHGLGKISEQKGILGPGPADLRFSEAL